MKIKEGKIHSISELDFYLENVIKLKCIFDA